jgi:membrane-associated phospholipid phosphatase
MAALFTFFTGCNVHVYKSNNFFGNPGWPFIFNVMIIEMSIAVLFYLVYGTTDFLTGLHNVRIPIHFSFETSLPFWPSMTLVYVSLFPAFFLTKFIIRDKKSIKALAWTLALETVLAGMMFLLIPAETAYPIAKDLGGWSFLFSAADVANLTYNLVPSLHVTYTITLAAAFAQCARSYVKAIVWIWAALMAMATLLTHQHHIVDVIAGFLFAAAMYKVVLIAYLGPQPTALTKMLHHFENKTSSFTRKFMLDW